MSSTSSEGDEQSPGSPHRAAGANSAVPKGRKKKGPISYAYGAPLSEIARKLPESKKASGRGPGRRPPKPHSAPPGHTSHWPPPIHAPPFPAPGSYAPAAPAAYQSAPGTYQSALSPAAALYGDGAYNENEAWTSGSRTSGGHVALPGDWICGGCSRANFRRRGACLNCDAPKTQGRVVGYQKLSPRRTDGHDDADALSLERTLENSRLGGGGDEGVCRSQNDFSYTSVGGNALSSDAYGPPYGAPPAGGQDDARYEEALRESRAEQDSRDEAADDEELRRALEFSKKAARDEYRKSRGLDDPPAPRRAPSDPSPDLAAALARSLADSNTHSRGDEDLSEILQLSQVAAHEARETRRVAEERDWAAALERSEAEALQRKAVEARDWAVALARSEAEAESESHLKKLRLQREAAAEAAAVALSETEHRAHAAANARDDVGLAAAIALSARLEREDKIAEEAAVRFALERSALDRGGRGSHAHYGKPPPPPYHDTVTCPPARPIDAPPSDYAPSPAPPVPAYGAAHTAYGAAQNYGAAPTSYVSAPTSYESAPADGELYALLGALGLESFMPCFIDNQVEGVQGLCYLEDADLGEIGLPPHAVDKLRPVVHSMRSLADRSKGPK